MAASSSSFLAISAPAATQNTGRGSGAPAASIRCRPLSVSAYCATTAERPPRTFGSGHGGIRIASPSSPYEVLGIGKGATCEEIKAAYRRLARMLHPDVVASSSDGQGDSMGREFMRVHEAYATLSDPDKRADYDRAVSARPRSSPVRAAGSASGFRTRKWETDQCW